MNLRLEMNLQLRSIRTTSFKVFNGATRQQMPLLIDEGRIPLSAADLMIIIRDLEALKSHGGVPKELKPAYALLMRMLGDYFFDTGDGAARHSDGRLKVVPDAPYLRLLTPKTRLVTGVVDLSASYAALTGEEFSPASVDRYCGMPLSKSDARNNPVWLALARGDKALLKEFVNARFESAKERFRYREDYMMGVYAPPIPRKGATGGIWTLYGGLSGWKAGGYEPLNLDVGRLIGVAPEAQRAAAGQHSQTLERRVQGV